MFVVEFLVCGERLGSRPEALERRWFGDYLGGFWEAMVDWSDGNCRREGVGFQLESGGVSGRFQVVSWGGMAGKCWRKKARCWVRLGK